MPFVQLGAMPGVWFVPHRAGPWRGVSGASELFLLGERFSPKKAQEVGIVNHVVDDEKLMDHVMEIAKRLALKSPAALMATKKLIKGHTAQQIRDAIQADGEMFGKLMSGPRGPGSICCLCRKKGTGFFQILELNFDVVVKSRSHVMPDVIRHPEAFEKTG